MVRGQGSGARFFLEGTRREKVKNNVFVTDIPGNHVIDGTDNPVVFEDVFNYINDQVDKDNYTIVKNFEPAQGRTRHSAR